MGDRSLEILRNRQFRMLFIGRIVSAVGDHLLHVATMWLVFDLTSSAFLTGVVGVLGRGPRLFQAFVGPVVDRNPLKRVLVGTELLQFAVVMVVPLVAYVWTLNVYVLLVVVPFLQMANLCSYPAQNATLPKVTTEDERVAANSLYSIAMQAVRTVGKAVGGVLIAVLGAVGVFSLNAATFLVGGALFARLRIPSEEFESGSGQRTSDDGYLDRLRNGYTLVANSILAHVVVAGLIANLLNGASLAVLPMFAAGVGGPVVYGLLSAGLGVGTVLGSAIASRFEDYRLGVVTTTGFLLAGGAWLTAVWVESVAMTVLLFSVAWVPIGVYNVLIRSTIQTGVPDELLGRVTAVKGSLGAIATPLGLLLGGGAGDIWSGELVIASAGVGFLLVSAYWFLVPTLWSFSSVRNVTPGQFHL